MSESDPESAREEIMHATYRALCEHGYADLTTKAIADESGTSTALLHYYFDTKEDLLVAFLEFLLERLQETVDVEAARDDPPKQLAILVEKLLFGPDDYKDFQTAMLELRSQAPFNAAYREQLRKNDREVTKLVADIVDRGIEAGVFRDVDPDRTARYLVATIDGARTQWVTLDDDAVLADVSEELRADLSERLLVGDRTLPRPE
ncbi:MAG: TetR/AcrR family transcriptional regulator [Haloarculaceae archaeon]